MDVSTGKTDPATELRSQDHPGDQGPGRQWRRPMVFLALARFMGLADRLGDLRDWIKSLGALGAVVFILIYVVGADAVLQGAAQGKVPWPLVLSFGAALIFLAILVRFAKRRLQAREQEGGTGPDAHLGGPSA
jgi:hypothetical protein